MVVEHRENRRRHGPKRRNRNIPPVSNSDRPVQKSIRHDGGRRRLKAVE